MVMLAACVAGEPASYEPDKVVALAIAPGAPRVPAGITTQLSVTASRRDGASFDVTAAAAWSSSDESIATVDGGSVSTSHPGVARISATFEGIVAAVDVVLELQHEVDLDIGPESDRVGHARAQTAAGQIERVALECLLADVQRHRCLVGIPGMLALGLGHLGTSLSPLRPPWQVSSGARAGTCPVFGRRSLGRRRLGDHLGKLLIG